MVIQGRAVAPADIQMIRELLADGRYWTRTSFSRELCMRWKWHTLLGQPKDMSCRSLLRKLEERGLIELPPRRSWRKSSCLSVRGVTIGPVEEIDADLGCLAPLQIEPVFPGSADVLVFNHLLATHHYLGYRTSVGETMRYLIRDRGGRLVACALFGAAAWKCAARDEFISWDASTRARNLGWVANNMRFLILPWVRVPHLASHLLGRLSRRINVDWQQRYGHRLWLLETFVDRSRFRGTCYQAANWTCVGQTKGRTRQDRYNTIRVAVKDAYVYPLGRHFRKELCHADS